ncbi:MAG: S41 family peptidase [Thermosynechococcaceae cyanobacterium]
MGCLLSLIASQAPVAISRATFQDSPKALVDQAWQIVQRDYVDRTFNHQDWQKLRSRYLDNNYSSKTAAYQAIAEMLATLDDPYTRFLPPEALQDLTQQVSGDFVGVGLTVRLDGTTREWIVENTFAESPAANAGLKPQDVVASLNGTPTPRIDPAKATPYLIGPVGSKISVQIRRGQQNLTYDLVREHINLNPLTYRTLDTPVGKVGYIRLPVFTSKSPDTMQRAIKSLETQKMTGYLLDLRGNPGGILDAGIAIAQMWLPQGTIVSVQERDKPTETIAAHHQNLTTKPLVVLVDHQSASASEVLAAALQDNKRAVLVGTVTFGKGLVQSFEPLNDNSGLLVTVAKYLTPKGNNIHHLGIKPDIAVETNGEAPTLDTSDRQYQTALVALIHLLRHQK